MRSFASISALAITVLVLAACGANTAKICEPSAQLDCTCPDGETSQKICLDEGVGYSACVGCKKDGGVFVPPLDDEDMLHQIFPDNADGGPMDLAGSDIKPPGMCSAATCTGCCDGNTCLTAPMQSDAKCHVGSMTTCQACPSGFSCVANNSCAKQTAICDAASCPSGCCDSGICLQADPTHCGKAGSTCSTCAAGTLCTAGTCGNDLDPNELFRIQVISVEVLPTNAQGAAWDTFSAPDPRVCFSDTFGSQGCTEECTDPPLPNPPLSPQRYVCGYNATTGLIDRGTNSASNDSMGTTLSFFGSELAQGLPFAVYDMDLNYSSNIISSGTMFKITKLQTLYSIAPFQQTYSLKFKIAVY